MSKQFVAAVKKVEGLRRELFRAHSSFRAFEVIQEMRAPNIIGETEASRNAKAIGDFKGFFNIAEHALNTEFLVSLAKIYDDHQDGTSLQKLLAYIRGNIKYFKLQDFLEYNKIRPDIGDRKSDYVEITLPNLKKIEDVLKKLSPQINKLKVIRDKRIAHLEMKNLEDLHTEEGPKTKIEDLTYEEIDGLIKTADTVLNKISSLINRDIAEFGPSKETVTQDSQRLIKEVRRVYDSLPSGKN